MKEYMHFSIASDSKTGDDIAMLRFSSPVQKETERWELSHSLPVSVKARESFRVLPDGEKHGRCDAHWDMGDSHVEQISNYFRGVLHGKMTTRRKDGDEKLEFRNGKVHGTCYKNGTKFKFKKGIISG